MKKGRVFRGVCAALAVAAGASACGRSRGPGGEPPAPALSESPAAQAELRRLLQRFAAGARADRIALKPALMAFRRQHPGDDLIRVVDAHLAWIALEQGDLGRAESLAAQLAAQQPGTTRDLAEVVRGAALRRRGKPDRALAALRPLAGKVIDAYVRALLNEELVTAAIEARSWAEAIDRMAVWLREAGEDERPAARAVSAALLQRVPPEDLARQLRARLAASAASRGDVSEAELDLRKLLANRLATVARERRDVRLAQELLTTSGPLLGSQGDAVAQLAAGAGAARVDTPTVGLLLSVRTAETRRRGVEVAAGVAHGIGLLGARQSTSGPVARLVSRSEGPANAESRPTSTDGADDAERPLEEGVDEALGALTAEGAAVLIAGLDRPQATAAAAFARAHEIPVLLLHPPDPPAVAGPYVFVIGDEPAHVVEILAAALVEKGVKPIAVVGDNESIVDATKQDGVGIALPCGGPMETRTFKLAAVQGLLLNGDAFCAERAMVATDGLSLQLAFGLEASAAVPLSTSPAPVDEAPRRKSASRGSAALLAFAGPYPFNADATNSMLEGWLEAHPVAPGWWAALGHDAGRLAWAGVRGLPLRATEDPAEVRARRRAAADGVARAEAALWTTSARGFEGGRVLRREIGQREVNVARSR